MSPDAPSATGIRVLFVGGPPGAGKTTTATATAARLGWASTTGSDLTAAIKTVTTPDTHPDIHLSGGIPAPEYFTNFPVQTLIDDATRQSDALWPVIERVTRLHLMEKDPLVLDWWLLDPVAVAAMDEPAVASVWLTIDIETLRDREQSVNGDFYALSPEPEQMFERFMARSAWRNEIAANAGHLGLPVVDVTNRTVDDIVMEVMERTGLS